MTEGNFMNLLYYRITVKGNIEVLGGGPVNPIRFFCFCQALYPDVRKSIPRWKQETVVCRNDKIGICPAVFICPDGIVYAVYRYIVICNFEGRASVYNIVSAFFICYDYGCSTSLSLNLITNRVFGRRNYRIAVPNNDFRLFFFSVVWEAVG